MIIILCIVIVLAAAVEVWSTFARRKALEDHAAVVALSALSLHRSVVEHAKTVRLHCIAANAVAQAPASVARISSMKKRNDPQRGLRVLTAN